MTQGDVIRADSKDIPRIFQILYATEAESRKPDDDPSEPVRLNIMILYYTAIRRNAVQCDTAVYVRIYFAILIENQECRI